MRRPLGAALVAACLAACATTPTASSDAAATDAGPPDASASCPVFGVASPLSFSLAHGAFTG